MMPDLHAVLSVEEELQRATMLEVEFLPDIDHITDATLQRITSIAMRHLGTYPHHNSFGNGSAHKTNKIPVAEEFQRNLHNFDRSNRVVFLERLDSYLSSIFDGTVRPMEHLMTTRQQQQPLQEQPHLRPNQRECYVIPMMSKTNEMLRRNEDSIMIGNVGRQQADIVLDAYVGQQTAATEDDNEDLAEADQMCSSDELYPTEDDLETHTIVDVAAEDERGAIGGLVDSRRSQQQQQQQLPDLANVSNGGNYVVEVSRN